MMQPSDAWPGCSMLSPCIMKPDRPKVFVPGCGAGRGGAQRIDACMRVREGGVDGIGATRDRPDSYLRLCGWIVLPIVLTCVADPDQAS